MTTLEMGLVHSLRKLVLTLITETPAEQVLRKLTFKRIEELDQAVKAERERYK